MIPGFKGEDGLVGLAAAVIGERVPGFRPRAMLVLGSGLGGVAATVERMSEIPYGELPGFPVPTVAGHDGRLVFGRLGGVPVACLSGREHWYEGKRCAGMTVAVRSLRRLGCELLVATCAAGSLLPEVGPGRLMLVTDHLNLLGGNPLIGPHREEWGPRCPDMAAAWDPGLAAVLRNGAARRGLDLAEGVYAAVSGPNFETPAEVRMLRRLGADAVGMSMVPECLVARQGGMKVAGCAVITNLAVGVGAEPVDHERTLAAARAAAGDLARLLAGFLEDWNR